MADLSLQSPIPNPKKASEHYSKVAFLCYKKTRYDLAYDYALMANDKDSQELTQLVKELSFVSEYRKNLAMRYEKVVDTIKSDSQKNGHGESSSNLSLGTKSQGISKAETEVTIDSLITYYKLPDKSRASIEKGLRNSANVGNVEHLKLFIKNVNDINCQDNNPEIQRTALHWAVIKGKKECVQELINCEARVDISDKAGKTALDYAQNDIELLNLLKPGAGPLNEI
jgi:ankyrin repeat protein